MDDLVKVCSKNCKKCVYHSYDGANVCCIYILIEGISRVFENGKLRNIPKGYCDRYTKYNENIRRKYNNRIHNSAIKLAPKEELKC